MQSAADGRLQTAKDSRRWAANKQPTNQRSSELQSEVNTRHKCVCNYMYVYVCNRTLLLLQVQLICQRWCLHLILVLCSFFGAATYARSRRLLLVAGWLTSWLVGWRASCLACWLALYKGYCICCCDICVLLMNSFHAIHLILLLYCCCYCTFFGWLPFVFAFYFSPSSLACAFYPHLLYSLIY